MPRVYTRQWKPGDLRIHPGTLDDIPLGWELAADMIDRAVVGAGGKYTKGQAFGGDSQVPTKPSVTVQNTTLSLSQMPSHSHTVRFSNVTSGYGDSRYGGDANKGASKSTESQGSSYSHGHSVVVGDVGSVDTRQLSIAVIWIRKL